VSGRCLNEIQRQRSKTKVIAREINFSGREIPLIYGRPFVVRSTEAYRLDRMESRRGCFSFNYYRHCNQSICETASQK